MEGGEPKGKPKIFQMSALICCPSVSPLMKLAELTGRLAVGCSVGLLQHRVTSNGRNHLHLAFCFQRVFSFTFLQLSKAAFFTNFGILSIKTSGIKKKIISPSDCRTACKQCAELSFRRQ